MLVVWFLSNFSGTGLQGRNSLKFTRVTLVQELALSCIVSLTFPNWGSLLGDIPLGRLSNQTKKFNKERRATDIQQTIIFIRLRLCRPVLFCGKTLTLVHLLPERMLTVIVRVGFYWSIRNWTQRLWVFNLIPNG